MESLYVPLSNLDEKLRGQKIITGAHIFHTYISRWQKAVIDALFLVWNVQRLCLTLIFGKFRPKWKRLSVHVPPAFPQWTFIPFAQKSFCYDGSRHTHKYITNRQDQLYYLHCSSGRMRGIITNRRTHRNTERFIIREQKFTSRPWPLTLTYNPSLAKVKVNPQTKNQGHRSNGSAVRVLTHRRKGGKTAPILLPRPLTREVKIPTNEKNNAKIIAHSSRS